MTPSPEARAVVSIIVACAENRVIGRGGRLPWSIPLDWNYFLETTRGGVLVMGRKCYEEMVHMGVINAERRFVVLSRQADYAAENPSCEVAHDFEQGMEKARAHRLPIWICGGQRVYEEALPIAERLYLTHVHSEVEGDTWFPEWQSRFTHLLSSHEAEDAGFRLTFMVLSKLKAKC
ncbi:MAG: dihydrofolate reductase [Verrucomicrobiota bacterium]|nr:dihydrofolate reductase [Verrucomicrobiota bacterium]